MPRRTFGAEELALVKEVLDSGKLSGLGGGQVTPRFEREFAAALGAKHGVAMNSAMSVLHASVLSAGAGAGDEVICDSVFVFGAVATMYANAVPVFVDVDPVTLNMNPDLVEAKITDRTKAIIVTHGYGLVAQMDRISEIARKHGLLIIEDCAHALFATYKGRYAGTWGGIGSFSFQMSKQLGLGDGGMAVTDDEALAKKLALHACAPTFLSVAHGLHYNYRMTEQTAAIGLAQLKRARGYIEGLRANARLYDQAADGCSWLRIQRAPEAAHSYLNWVCTFAGEEKGLSLDDFKRVAKEVDLGVGIGYTQMPAYKHPLIAQRLGHGRGCPLDCPHYSGSGNRYPDGLCPVAERVIPRILTCATFIAEDACKANADKLRRVIEKLG